jgi:hypothetical protein
MAFPPARFFGPKQTVFTLYKNNAGIFHDFSGSSEFGRPSPLAPG